MKIASPESRSQSLQTLVCRNQYYIAYKEAHSKSPYNTVWNFTESYEMLPCILHTDILSNTILRPIGEFEQWLILSSVVTTKTVCIQVLLSWISHRPAVPSLTRYGFDVQLHVFSTEKRLSEKYIAICWENAFNSFSSSRTTVYKTWNLTTPACIWGAKILELECWNTR